MSGHLTVTSTRLIRAMDGTGSLQVKRYADGSVDLSPLQGREPLSFVSLSSAGARRLVALLSEPGYDIEMVAAGDYPGAPTDEDLKEWEATNDVKWCPQGGFWMASLNDSTGIYNTRAGALHLLHHCIRALNERREASDGTR